MTINNNTQENINLSNGVLSTESHNIISEDCLVFVAAFDMWREEQESKRFLQEAGI